MMGLFRRASGAAFDGATPADCAALGTLAIAQRSSGGAAVPPGCTGVAFTQGGQTRRVEAGARLALAPHESAACFHPGPYTFDLVPFAAAPELGLRLTFAIDCPDPRVAQQRFDLYLASEAPPALTLAAFGAALEAALQRELAQGNMDLPPCTSLAEWSSFRAALNQLCYTRFGVTVDDCLPVDLGSAVDYAAILLARAEAMPAAPAPQATLDAGPPRAQPIGDAAALRRLFLELPSVMCALRLACLPPGQALFRQHQALLERLDQVSLSVTTMPALALAAPGVALDAAEQARRAQAAAGAVTALDEAWALLARLALAPAAQLALLFDDAERIVANLEWHCQERRIAQAGEAA